MSQGHKQPPELTLWVETTDLYRHIPQGHFYERLAQILDLSFVYELTRPLYAPKLGRPSLDPVVFFKCMLAGFFENVLYDTELEYRIADSLTLRKFLGYSLEERTPDESTLRKTRRSMPEEVFHAVFARVLDQCQVAGLLKGRVVGTDSTQVDANASMESLRHKTLGCTYEEYILALRRQDQPEATPAEAKAGDRNRTGKASNQEWESTTDPQARVMQHADGHTHLSFRVDTTVDLETGVIVVAGAEYANVSDQADFLGRVDEAEVTLAERGLELRAVVADKGHHSGENLAGLQERELVGLLSSPNSTRGQPGFRRADFTYDAERDLFVCPIGVLLQRRQMREGVARQYQARGSDCRACPHFGVCTQSKTGRSLSVPVHEALIQENRVRGQDPELRPLFQLRRQRGEGPFGYFKQFGGLRRFAGRGLEYAQKKTLIAGIGWNLLRLLADGALPAAARLLTGPFRSGSAFLTRRWRLSERFWVRKPRVRGWEGDRVARNPIACECRQIAPLSGGC
jgi:transposase